MIDASIRSALITILKSKRRKMNPAQRKRGLKPTRWLYPWTTEKHYAAAIRAWFRPMRDYVKTYIKEHSESILHGDSASLVVRQDATTGKTFNLMVRSLEGWVGQYISDDPERKRESPIYMGLDNIANTVFDFNEGQYEKSAKASLGIEFPVGEDWWPGAKENWQNRNYDLIRSDLKRYIGQINDMTERAVTSGWSLSEMTRQMMALDSKLSEGRARFVARDQIGKLNGHISQRRMESAGLSMYIWSTSGDERVRGDPGGFFPDAMPSHYAMDGLLCRWDDPTVYSDDGGKTWRDRPSGAVKLHPGEDYQCRCTALAYWQEIVDEADEQIDLLGENEDNIPNTGKEGLLVMKPPSVKSANQSVQQNQRTAAAQRLAMNREASEAIIKREYPDEKFLSTTAALQKASEFTTSWKLPKNVNLASARIPKSKRDAEILEIELKNAGNLARMGNSVYLTPEPGRYKERVSDAIVNGVHYEFRNVTGKAEKIERRFARAKEKDPKVNVFINVDSDIGKDETLRRLRQVLDRHPDYTGKIVVTFKGRTPHFWDSGDLR
jgi:uncharacterized protein with gpF-like domain